jgi:hypothetical protein
MFPLNSQMERLDVTWSMMERALALSCVLHFMSWARQIVPLIGANGLEPVTELLRRSGNPVWELNAFFYVASNCRVQHTTDGNSARTRQSGLHCTVSTGIHLCFGCLALLIGRYVSCRWLVRWLVQCFCLRLIHCRWLPAQPCGVLCGWCA